MIKNIYLIRHGETDYNRRGVVQGSGIDADLNDLGRAQAQAFFEKYQGVTFDKIYVSALKRTHQSVKSFIEENIDWEIQAGLNEISWGIKEGQIPNYQDDAYYNNLISNWQRGNITMPAQGGESPQQVKDRQLPVIDLIISRPEEQTILIAMHGRAMRILLTVLFREPLSDMDKWQHQNLCLYLLQYDYETQKFSLISGNDTAHLKQTNT